MTDVPAEGPDTYGVLLEALVETLAAQGVGCDEYQLYETVDVVVLDQLIHDSTGDLEVRVTVEGIRLAVSTDGVRVLDDGSG